MATGTPLVTPQTSTTTPDDSLGIDRAFVIQMARMPLLALGWFAAAIIAHRIWGVISPTTLNAGPLVVVCFGMILAAFIDGWALKVPNWVTLPLILSGWMLGVFHDCGYSPDGGTGGIGIAVLGTFWGFALLFPMLAIGGVGVGDVKMQMGFGAWVAAFFGTGATTAAANLNALHGMGVILWAFVFGACIGGAFAIIMIVIRRNFSANARMVKEIFQDLLLVSSGHMGLAGVRAQERRKIWVKLPYGIPLCVGFIMYLTYVLILNT